MGKYIILLFTLWMAWGCKNDEIEDVKNQEQTAFETQETLGLYVASKPAFIFDKMRHQRAKGNNFYRIQTDLQDTCLMCRWNHENGEYLQVNIRAIGLETLLKSGDYKMKVVKKSGQKCWLWHEEQEIGCVVEMKDGSMK